MKNKLWLIMIILIMSCTRNNKQVKLVDSVAAETIENDIITESIPIDKEIIISWDNYDWLTEFDWALSDGREYVDPTAEYIYWVGKAPVIRIYKYDLPSEIDLYQIRLRNERFRFMYQAKEKDKLYSLENTFFSNFLEIKYTDNYSRLTLLQENGNFYSGGERTGEQSNPDYPLVGIWGKLPSLNEYRLINPADCLYYLEIDKEIPKFAIRRGTYLLKQTGEKEFETISSFPDGQLRLEFIDDRSMLITPLFTLPDDEEGIVGHLIMNYNPNHPRFSTEDD